MPPPVLRVFVSSTWIDLQPERQAVEQALARLRETKFIGMEHFGSRAETTRDVSLLEVNPTDLYVGIIGGRYGSGITEDEYRRALELKLHCFIYFKDEATIGPEGRDAEPEKAGRLARLKEDMRRHCSTTFRSPDDLSARLTADLHRWIVDRYVQGIAVHSPDYAARINGFLAEYLGTPRHPVPFGGRQAELDDLDGWLDDPRTSPYLLLAAPAGRGKSALLVRWTQRLLTRPDLAVAFLPVSIRFRTNLAGVVFPALATRLASLHGEKVPGPDTGVEVWRDLLAGYLGQPLPDGRRLLVVLDGLDEAADWELGPDLFPGSPPEGLRVLLSARASDAGSWLAALGWDRPGLGRALDLARLTAAGVADVLQRMGCPLDELGRRVDLVAELHRLSEGDPLLVRLYVDDLWARGQAVVRLRPEDLRGIRPGLQGYFTRWWEDQRRLWGDQTPLREPAVQGLLNLLACALGPLGRDDVLRLVPPELGLTTWTLEETLRPLVRFVLGDGERQGYVFSHPRWGGYFHERLSTRERQATESRFLAWGEETLAGLNEGRLPPGEAPPYVVQYYATHMKRARQGPEKLLALVSDGWRRAWEALEGSDSGFLNDVGRSWRAASGANEAQVKRGGLAGYLGEEVRCALCRASVQSLAGNIPPALLKAAVEHGQWTAIQGLAYARQMVKPEQRTEALAALAPHLLEPLRSDVLAQALETARVIEHEFYRSGALATLAPHLPELLLEQALEATWDIKDERYLLRVLAALAPHLGETLLAQALEVARAWRWQALGFLAPHLAEPLRSDVLAQALEAAQATGDEVSRSDALSALAPHLPESLLMQALEAARAIGDSVVEEGADDVPIIRYKYDRSRALSALAPHLPEPLRSEVLVKALEDARAIEHGYWRSMVFSALGPHLPEPLRSEVLALALEDARASKYEDDRSRALSALAPHLPDQLLALALEVARAIGGKDSRSRALSALAPHLPEPLLAQALENARAFKDEDSRSQALSALAPHLPEPLRSEVLPKALEDARAFKDEDNRSDALSALAPHLPEPLLAQALEDARAFKDEDSRSQALSALAPHLSDRLLAQALEVARAIGDEDSRSQALSALAPHLPEPLRSEVLPKALEDARAFKDEDNRSDALSALAPHLPEPLLAQALEDARAFKDEDSRSQALSALAPHLSDRLLAQALEVARAIQSENSRSVALSALASHLPEPQRGELLADALEAVRAIQREVPRSQRLAALAPHLPEQLLAQALEVAQAIGDKHDRSVALSALVPHLPEPLRSEVLAKTLEDARAIQAEKYRSQRLAVLAPRLSASSASCLFPLWEQPLPILASRTRRDLLADLRSLLPIIHQLGGPQAVADIFRAIQDVGRWWP